MDFKIGASFLTGASATLALLSMGFSPLPVLFVTIVTLLVLIGISNA